jgi:hypothetical protein
MTTGGLAISQEEIGDAGQVDYHISGETAFERVSAYFYS